MFKEKVTREEYEEQMEWCINEINALKNKLLKFEKSLRKSTTKRTSAKLHQR